MKKSKKIILAPLMLGALVGTSACSLTDVNVNKESMDRIETAINEYMDKNNAYSSDYARDSLVSLLNEGMFALTSNQYVNYELTQIIKAYDDIGNKAHASEWYCPDGKQQFSKIDNECFHPYLNIKSYYDEATKTAKRYVLEGTYSLRSADHANINREYYVFIEEVGLYNYHGEIYDVKNKKFRQYTQTSSDFSSVLSDNVLINSISNVYPIKYYNILYKKVNSDNSLISYNKVNDTTVEYFIYDSQLDITIKSTFVNGMLEKYEQSDTTAFYGEGTNNAVVEVNIKYSCDGLAVPNAETYTEVTE